MKGTKIKNAYRDIFSQHSALKCYLSNNILWFNCRLLKHYYYYRYAKFLISKFYFYRKYSKYSCILNVQLNCQNILSGFRFGHQNVVICKHAIIGKNFSCAGNNCIGTNKHGSPTIGDNVKMGFGAIIVGNVTIADDCCIGAGAVVTKSCLTKGSTIVGINRIL